MPVKNEIGNRYGKLVVIKREENSKNGNARWLCQCDCGNTKIVFGSNLRSGKSKSCGCNNFIDETGNIYGQLKVIKLNKREDRRTYWDCQCDCGNITIVRGDSLRYGTTKSCGCLVGQNSSIDEVGNRYGKLLVIKRHSTNKNRHATWECKCDCGNTTITTGNALRNGSTKSCGCLKSYGERVIQIFLEKNNIFYQKEYTFKDLLSKKGGELRFDFAIFDSKEKIISLIEFDGEQHYNKNNKWYSKELVENDKRKNEYCKKHNIPLIRLRNYEDLKIEDLII